MPTGTSRPWSGAPPSFDAQCGHRVGLGCARPSPPPSGVAPGPAVPAGRLSSGVAHRHGWSSGLAGTFAMLGTRPTPREVPLKTCLTTPQNSPQGGCGTAATGASVRWVMPRPSDGRGTKRARKQPVNEGTTKTGVGTKRRRKLMGSFSAEERRWNKLSGGSHPSACRTPLAPLRQPWAFAPFPVLRSPGR